MGLQRVRHNWATELNWSFKNHQKSISQHSKYILRCKYSFWTFFFFCCQVKYQEIYLSKLNPGCPLKILVLFAAFSNNRCSFYHIPTVSGLKAGYWNFLLPMLLLWRRKWQPTPVFLPGESHGQRSLVGYSLWGSKESDIAEVTYHSTFFMYVVFHNDKIQFKKQRMC